MSTVVVRGSGGAVFTMDVPTSGPALKQWDEQIAKGDLAIVSDAVASDPEPEVSADEVPEVDEPEAPKPRRGRPPKAKPTDSGE